MTPFTIRRSLAALAFVACGSGAALARQPVVKVARGTETGEAPGDPGARRANIGNIQPTSNAERRDASPVECRVTFTTGCQGSPSPILDGVRVRQLVASEAPADQAALAAHFTALADRHASAARLHDTMGRSAAINPRGNGQEMKIHCQRLAGLERQAAATLRELAAHHAALGKGAASTAPARGAKYQAGAEARQPGDADMNALARRASTPADHRALQDYFQTFAARYEAEADGHVGMATLYRTTSRLAPVANHCDRLVTQLRAAAAEATQAATMHGVLATPK